MSNRRRSNMQAQSKPALPPIITEDDGELPFLKQDFFSDVAILVSTDEPTSSREHHGSRRTQSTVVNGKKLYSARSLLAYNSLVFEKSLGNSKKHEVDMSDKNYDDVVELLCYLDPRVQYTITAQSARQLLPMSEEFEMRKLKKLCVETLQAAYEKLRKEYSLGKMPSDFNEEYLVMADRYDMTSLLEMTTDEYVANIDATTTRSSVNSDTMSQKVKLLILQKKFAKLNGHLEKERKYRSEAEYKANQLEPKSNWSKYWHADDGPLAKIKLFKT